MLVVNNNLRFSKFQKIIIIFLVYFLHISLSLIFGFDISGPLAIIPILLSVFFFNFTIAVIISFIIILTNIIILIFIDGLFDVSFLTLMTYIVAFVSYISVAYIGTRLKLLNQKVKSQIKDLETEKEKLQREISEKKYAVDLLRESEERIRIIFNKTFEGIVITRDEKILQAGKGFAKLFGYNTDELEGMEIRQFIHQDSYAHVHNNYSQQFEEAYAFTGKTKDGTIFPCEVVGTYCHYQGMSARISALRDLTEEIKVKQEKELLRKRLENSNKLISLGDLAAGVAHDFKNLITIIRLNAELIEFDFDINLKEIAHDIILTSDRAFELTNQLLSFAREKKPIKKSFNIHEMIINLHSLLQRTLGKNIRINYESDASFSNIEGDENQIFNAMLNIALNARDAMPNGGDLQISCNNSKLSNDDLKFLDLPSDGDYIQIEISDTGTGMDEKTKDRIFEPFFTTKDSGIGTGLGLSTCFGVIKEHGGDIVVESELGKGSVFKLILPTR